MTELTNAMSIGLIELFIPVFLFATVFSVIVKLIRNYD